MMAGRVRAKIGSVAVHSAEGKAKGLQTLFPEEVEVDVIGLRLLVDDRTVGSLHDLKGKREIYLNRVPELAVERKWEGVAISGAPVELLNPGLLQELQAKLAIPVTTAITSSVAAIKAFRAGRVLSITPYDEKLDELLQARLDRSGIEAIPPASKPFPNFGAASKLSDEEVFLFIKEAHEGAGDVPVVYIQSILNRLPILERVEQQLGTTVVSSSLAPLWYLISKLGLSYHVRGRGKLLQEWPRLLDG